MSAPSSTLPSRTNTHLTEDEAVPEEDSSEVTKLFLERLQAWKHACGYLEDYVTATEKMYGQHTKEYERVLKTVSSPLKEGHHFDQSLGGVAGLFDNIRSNTQGLANSNRETEKKIKGSVLPILERLHAEVKNKSKELTKGAGKGAKLVDKARNSTQKHVELLGQHTAAYDSTGGKITAADDPYIIQRQVYHRLNKQIVEENNNRQDLISVQNSFASFEAHVVQTFQDALNQFNQIVAQQSEQTRSYYGDITGNAQAVRPDFEWNGFLKRNNSILIDPNGPPRSLDGVNFPNQDHHATIPMIAGSLERKGKLLKKYETAFYVVTPSKFLHEFKTDDDFAKDPVPEVSLYIPDCTIGALDGDKFNVKGKDSSKGGIGNKFSMSHEYAFKAHTAADAENWYRVLSHVASGEETGVGGTAGHTTAGSTAAPVAAGTAAGAAGAAGATAHHAGPASGSATSPTTGTAAQGGPGSTTSPNGTATQLGTAGTGTAGTTSAAGHLGEGLHGQPGTTTAGTAGTAGATGHAGEGLHGQGSTAAAADTTATQPTAGATHGVSTADRAV